MSLIFVECNKAVSLDVLWPNFWSLFGYPRLFGHWKNGAVVEEQSQIYLESNEEFQKYQKMRKALPEKGWQYAYELTLEQAPHGTFKVASVVAINRVCAAK